MWLFSGLFCFVLPVCLAAIPAPTLPATPSVVRPTPLRQVPVADGAALQTALNNALDGDEILLTAGTTYRSPGGSGFSLRRRNGGVRGGWVIVRTAGVTWPLGDRVGRNLNLAKIQYGGASPEFSYALFCAVEGPQTNYWMGFRFELVEFVGVNGQRRLISLQSDRSVATNPLPTGFVFDQVWVHPNAPTDENTFGFSVNVQEFALINSIVENIHGANTLSQESKCFGATEGSLYLLDNNYLSCASMSILIGGSNPLNPLFIASDLTFTRNHLFTPLSWQGGPWFTIKNHFELKTGRRVLFEGNVLENMWKDTFNPAQGQQAGYSINLWAADSPSETAHVTIRNNIVRNTIRALTISTRSTNPVQPDVHDILVENLLVEDGTLMDTGSQRQIQVGSVGNLVFRKSSFFLAPSEYCFFIYSTNTGSTGKDMEVDRVYCGPSTVNFGGWSLDPTAYSSVTSSNNVAWDTLSCPARYPSTGWTCVATDNPGAAGVDMAALNQATMGSISGVWTTPTTSAASSTTPASPTTTAAPTTQATSAALSTTVANPTTVNPTTTVAPTTVGTSPASSTTAANPEPDE